MKLVITAYRYSFLRKTLSIHFILETLCYLILHFFRYYPRRSPKQTLRRYYRDKRQRLVKMTLRCMRGLRRNSGRKVEKLLHWSQSVYWKGGLCLQVCTIYTFLKFLVRFRPTSFGHSSYEAFVSGLSFLWIC